MDKNGYIKFIELYSVSIEASAERLEHIVGKNGLNDPKVGKDIKAHKDYVDQVNERLKYLAKKHNQKPEQLDHGLDDNYMGIHF